VKDKIVEIFLGEVPDKLKDLLAEPKNLLVPGHDHLRFLRDLSELMKKFAKENIVKKLNYPIKLSRPQENQHTRMEFLKLPSN